jgi:hypothetical protein
MNKPTDDVTERWKVRSQPLPHIHTHTHTHTHTNTRTHTHIHTYTCQGNTPHIIVLTGHEFPCPTTTRGTLPRWRRPLVLSVYAVVSVRVCVPVRGRRVWLCLVHHLRRPMQRETAVHSHSRPAVCHSSSGGGLICCDVVSPSHKITHNNTLTRGSVCVCQTLPLRVCLSGVTHTPTPRFYLSAEAWGKNSPTTPFFSLLSSLSSLSLSLSRVLFTVFIH